MNIFESIKSEKKMSLNHWRYRILHWCFDQSWEDWENDWKAHSDLPYFLYTHYCPLFHITNLIAILFPIVLMVKIVVGLCCGIKKCSGLIIAAISSLPWQKLANTIEKFNIAFKWSKKSKNIDVSSREEARKKETIKNEKRRLLRYMVRSDYTTFDELWNMCCDMHSTANFSFLSKEDAEQLFNKHIEKILKAKKQIEERKERTKQRLIFWSNFSQVFLRCFFNIAYVIIAILVFWGFCKVTPQVLFFMVDCVKFLMTFDTLSFLIAFGWILLRVIIVGGACSIVIYGFCKLKILQKCGLALTSSLVAVSPPFVLVGNLFCLPFQWVATLCNNTVEFVGMFYEENCPPITIVSGEEEIITNELEE